MLRELPLEAKCGPQRLKPRCEQDTFGTAEAVPLSKTKGKTKGKTKARRRQDDKARRQSKTTKQWTKQWTKQEDKARGRSKTKAVHHDCR
jgi:hypothetical protein